jgi:hypothetical protein
MLEETGEQSALIDSLPVQGRFVNQKMKERIIGGRDRSSETCLAWSFLFPIREVFGLLK